jgi:hypothetical protein
LRSGINGKSARLRNWYLIKTKDKEEKFYSKILVSLDGSELAEYILPHMESMAKGPGVDSVLFIHVELWLSETAYLFTTV